VAPDHFRISTAADAWVATINGRQSRERRALTLGAISVVLTRAELSQRFALYYYDFLEIKDSTGPRVFR